MHLDPFDSGELPHGDMDKFHHDGSDLQQKIYRAFFVLYGALSYSQRMNQDHLSQELFP